MTDARALLDEYGVEIIGTANYPKPGQTRAPGSVQRILDKHGEDHARLMLSTIAETANNALCMDETGFWSVSDMVRVCRPFIDERPSDWLDFFDRLPLGDLQFVSQELYGRLPPRFLLDGMIWERVVKVFGRNAGQPDLFDDRGPYGREA